MVHWPGGSECYVYMAVGVCQYRTFGKQFLSCSQVNVFLLNLRSNSLRERLNGYKCHLGSVLFGVVDVLAAEPVAPGHRLFSNPMDRNQLFPQVLTHCSPIPLAVLPNPMVSGQMLPTPLAENLNIARPSCEQIIKSIMGRIETE